MQICSHQKTQSSLHPKFRMGSRSLWSQIRPLVFLLILVAIGIQWASRPKSWYWLLPPDSQTILPESTSVSSSASQATASAVTVELEPDLSLGKIQDRTSGLTKDDRVGVAEIVEELSTGTSQTDFASQEVTFLHLISSPQTYRGKLIPIDGTLVKITASTLKLDDEKTLKVDEAWLMTPESGDKLIHCYLLKQPGALADLNLPTPASFTGIFFKLQGYQSVNGPQIAPLFFAQQVELSPITTTEELKSSLDQWSWLVGLLGLTGIAISFYCYRHLTTRTHSSVITGQREEQQILSELADLEDRDKSAPDSVG